MNLPHASLCTPHVCTAMYCCVMLIILATRHTPCGSASSHALIGEPFTLHSTAQRPMQGLLIYDAEGNKLYERSLEPDVILDVIGLAESRGVKLYALAL